MEYEVYRYIFYGGAILAIIMLIISLILFFVLNIPAVIGDLSGATARKAIENIRNQNENTGEKAYKSSAVNKERGKLTDKISQSGSLLHKETDELGMGMKTEKISTQKLAIEEPAGETTVLDSGNETTVLHNDSGETTVLDAGMSIGNETTLLTPDMQMQAAQIPSIFEIEYEITFIHTQEVIV